MPSQSQILAAAALSLASLAVGYHLGNQFKHLAGEESSTVFLPPSAPSEATLTAEDTKEQHLEEVEEDEDEEGSMADGDLAAITAGFLEPCKMVLVVRTDLGMTPGKIAAQCGHATLACYKALVKKNEKLIRHWERTGQAKIALKANSEEELIELEAIAKSLNLCARPIHDAGHTQVASGTRTVLAIGPAPVPLINEVTGKLRLL